MVGRRIRELRENFDHHRPLSQAALAEPSGLARQRISELETGRADWVRVHELGWIADALGVPLRALFQRNLGEVSSLGLPAHLTWVLKNRATTPSSDVTPAEIDALTALCDDAERLLDSGQFWQVEYLLEQLLPKLAASVGNTKEGQARLRDLRERMTKACLQRVDAEIRQLDRVRNGLTTMLRASHSASRQEAGSAD